MEERCYSNGARKPNLSRDPYDVMYDKYDRLAQEEALQDKIGGGTPSSSSPDRRHSNVNVRVALIFSANAT